MSAACERADALDVGPVELHRHAEGDRADDGRLVGGVDALRCRRSDRPRRSRAAAPRRARSRSRARFSRISERMKLVVPLMMPAIHSMRLAVSPSRSALMIGMPPATAASKATMTPFSRAAAKISLPCTASSALLAVTTCLPAPIASSTSSRAMPVPPISSTTDVELGHRDQCARVVGDRGGGRRRASGRAPGRGRRSG